MGGRSGSFRSKGGGTSKPSLPDLEGSEKQSHGQKKLEISILKA